jgi:hypothetical protein
MTSAQFYFEFVVGMLRSSLFSVRMLVKYTLVPASYFTLPQISLIITVQASTSSALVRMPLSGLYDHTIEVATLFH